VALSVENKSRRAGRQVSSVRRAVFWNIVALVGVVAIFMSYYLPENFFVTEGQISPATIEADKSVTYEDTARTEANRRAAAERVGDIFVFDTAVLERQVDQVDQIFAAWGELLSLPETRPEPVQVEVGELTGAEAEAAVGGAGGGGAAGAGAGGGAAGAGAGGDRAGGGGIGGPGGAAGGTGAETGSQGGGGVGGQSGSAGGGDDYGGIGIGGDWEDLPAETAPEPTRMEAAAPYITQLQIKESTAEAILSLDTVTLQALRGEAVGIMAAQWTKGIRTEEVEEARKRILDEVYLRINQEEQVSFLQAIFRFIYLEANFIFDEETTLRARDEAARLESPVLNTVYRNQKVIGKGEVVTANHIEILKALGYQRSREPYIMVLGVVILTLGFQFLLMMYLRLFPPKMLRESKYYSLMTLLFLVVLLLARLVVAINISPEPALAEQIAYLIPAAVGAILTAILLDKWLGVLFAAIFSFYVGILAGGNLSYAIVAFAGSAIGIYGVGRYGSRLEWAKAGLMIALINVWLIVGLGALNSLPYMTVLYGAIMGAVNGFFSPILAYGSLPFLESAFGITTNVSLMELANPRQPLLKELLLKAPGTYHHSILVGNLAEAAADAIGADPILVRVGAYYHDVGKTRRPYFFVENQLGEANPHDKLTPALSALILSSHVKDGMELGRKNGLPEKVLEFIEQHHGNGIMAFFYHKALEEAEEPEKVKESDFRYPGPRPQSKETGIVLLADSTEAAIRSMKIGGDKIEAAVKKIINDKMMDGQLDDSQLSLSELKVIAQSFTQVLNGIYHSRIEYPDNVLAVMRKGEEAGADEAVEPESGVGQTAGPGTGEEAGTGQAAPASAGAAVGAGAGQTAAPALAGAAVSAAVSAEKETEKNEADNQAAMRGEGLVPENGAAAAAGGQADN
jgi:putative nucleotidyltransferase with HDIG domain